MSQPTFPPAHYINPASGAQVTTCSLDPLASFSFWASLWATACPASLTVLPFRSNLHPKVQPQSPSSCTAFLDAPSPYFSLPWPSSRLLPAHSHWTLDPHSSTDASLLLGVSMSTKPKMGLPSKVLIHRAISKGVLHSRGIQDDPLGHENMSGLAVRLSISTF